MPDKIACCNRCLLKFHASFIIRELVTYVLHKLTYAFVPRGSTETQNAACYDRYLRFASIHSYFCRLSALSSLIAGTWVITNPTFPTPYVRLSSSTFY